MIVSRCCKQEVYVAGSGCTHYYVCVACNIACDTVMSLLMETYDAEHGMQTKA